MKVMNIYDMGLCIHIEVALTDIIMIEAQTRGSYVYTTRRIIETNLLFKDLLEQLNKEKQFCQSHRVFLVNIHHVKDLKKDMLLLENDYKAEISRRKREQFLKRYCQNGGFTCH